ncbi:MAG: recombinase RecX [Bacteroidetes bacterium]|nr:MAG: recombinase RecX [Bacteroidota bacterium]
MTEVPGERPRAGVVTRLVAQKKDANRVSVYLDGTFAFGVHADVVVAFGLAKGQHLTEAACARMLAADAVYRARTAALAYLAHRPRTEAEVRRKLAEKGFDAAVVEDVVARLHDLGYLDDAAYARSYVQARFSSRGYGPQRLRAELRRRGVDPAHAQAALDDLLDDDAVLEEARRHARRRWEQLAGEADHRRKRKKLSDYLVRRGFSYDTVRRVVEELERAG